MYNKAMNKKEANIISKFDKEIINMIIDEKI